MLNLWQFIRRLSPLRRPCVNDIVCDMERAAAALNEIAAAEAERSAQLERQIEALRDEQAGAVAERARAIRVAGKIEDLIG